MQRSEPERAASDRGVARSAGARRERPSKDRSPKGRGPARGQLSAAPRGSASPTPRGPIGLTPEIEAELAEIAAASGCELLHAEWKGGVLRLILDRLAPMAPMAERQGEDGLAGDAGEPGGVSLGDCELVAKQASALLDVLDFGSGRFLLEVSSPGLDRQLYRPSDYRRFVGRLVRVTHETGAPSGAVGKPARRTVVARLVEALPEGAGGVEAVTLLDDRTGERLTLRLEDIRLARLEVVL